MCLVCISWSDLLHLLFLLVLFFPNHPLSAIIRDRNLCYINTSTSIKWDFFASFLKMLCKHSVCNIIWGCVLKTSIWDFIVAKIYCSIATPQSKFWVYYFATLINLLNINDEKAIQVMLYRELQYCWHVIIPFISSYA